MATDKLQRIGRRFHNYLKSIVPNGEEGDIFTPLQIAETLDYRDLLSKYLNKIKFTEEVYLHIATVGNGLGDNSWFYIGNIEEEQSPTNAAVATCCEMTAWQLYLLESATHILPSFWHGGYSNRKYIFYPKDILYYKSLIGPKAAEFAKNDELLPSVIVSNSYAFVRCTYWNDWAGLVRETKRIEFSDSKVVSTKTIKKENIYKYDCGILF